MYCSRQFHSCLSGLLLQRDATTQQRSHLRTSFANALQHTERRACQSLKCTKRKGRLDRLLLIDPSKTCTRRWRPFSTNRCIDLLGCVQCKSGVFATSKQQIQQRQQFAIESLAFLYYISSIANLSSANRPANSKHNLQPPSL